VSGAERSGPKIGWSRAERGAGVAENDGAGAQREVAEREQSAWRGYRNRLERGAAFRRSRSAHMLCI